MMKTALQVVCFALLMTLLAPVAAAAPRPERTVADEAHTADSGFAVRDERVQSYFEAFSTGDPQAYRRWLEHNRTPASLGSNIETRLAQYRDDFTRWGTLTIGQLRVTERGSVEAVVRASETGEQLTFLFDFQHQEPFLVSALHIRVGGPPEDEIIFPEDWNSLDELAQTARTASGVPALAIGVYHGGAAVTAVAGVRRSDAPDLARIDDAFAWGSVTKSVTGTMLGALIDRGVLDWNTTIGDVLGEAPIDPSYRDVTLWQLMAHQAGIAAYTRLDPAFDREIAALPGVTLELKRAAFVEQMLRQPPAYTPGTSAQYSNGGPTVAARMAEVVSGKSWEQLVRETVFDPLHLETAGFGLPVTPAHPDGVYGHVAVSPGQFEPVPAGQGLPDPDVLAPAGAVRSSIGDFLLYGIAHLKGMTGEEDAFPADLIRSLHTPQSGQPQSLGEEYTFGWGSDCPAGLPQQMRCQGHNGSNGAYYARILILPDKDMVIVFMANGMPAAEAVSSSLFGAIYNHAEQGKSFE